MTVAEEESGSGGSDMTDESIVASKSSPGSGSVIRKLFFEPIKQIEWTKRSKPNYGHRDYKKNDRRIKVSRFVELFEFSIFGVIKAVWISRVYDFNLDYHYFGGQYPLPPCHHLSSPFRLTRYPRWRSSERILSCVSYHFMPQLTKKISEISENSRTLFRKKNA